MSRNRSRTAPQARDPLEKFAKLFPDCPRDALLASSEPWPALEGCLVILFASRSGSTFLAREIESRYRIGQIGESFNPPQLKSRAMRAGIATPALAFRHAVETVSEAGWFGVKAGAQTIRNAELTGFVDAYLPKARFITLFRRDLVAQAVSFVKAEMTGRFHSGQTEARPVDAEGYDRKRILKKAKTMLRSMQALDGWLEPRKAPKGKLFYEDFRDGDFGTVATLCDAFQLPARTERKVTDSRAVTKIGDDVNDEWCRRFRDKHDNEAADILEQFERLTRA
jgi:LPS sulfotransferase NodH